jgi:hypothetical protein
MPRGAQNVIRLNPRSAPSEEAATDELSLSLHRLGAAAQELSDLQSCLGRIVRDPRWSAAEWKAACSPLLLHLPKARQSLAELDGIRAGRWPDIDWAVRLRAARGEVDRRLMDLSISVSMLGSEETSSSDAVIAFSSDAMLLAEVVDGLRDLIASRYPQWWTTRSDGGSPLTEDPSPQGFVGQLRRQRATLRDFLRSIEDDARLLDASAADAHQIAVGICKVINDSVFGPHGALDRFSHQDTYNIFEHVRADENDLYDVYTDALQRHQKRQRKDLGVAESDSDKFVVVKRRRRYISTLTAFQAEVSAILDLLHAPHTSGG